MFSILAEHMAPLIKVAPTLEQKLEVLGQAAAYDLSCACGPTASRSRGVDGRWIYPAALPSGERVPMLKVLQQSGCERGCAYCAERLGGVGHDPVSFSPDELAQFFIELLSQRRVFGLFLSSAIRGGAVSTMDRLLATAEILRYRMQFRGYLHLKILPGARPNQVDRAMALATRVSLNIEAPTAEQLLTVAPSKTMKSQILDPMRQIAKAESERRFNRSGQTTQFVVGASNESDRQIVRAASWLYGNLQMRRVYYSGFQPVSGTPLQERTPTPFLREHRLYQVDFLLRQYGFTFEEIPFGNDGQLAMEHDPKTLWAQRHPEFFPLEVNTAPSESLLRVPGLGPRSVKRLIKMRREGHLRHLADLRSAGINPCKSAPYLLLDGRAARLPQQLELFC